MYTGFRWRSAGRPVILAGCRYASPYCPGTLGCATSGALLLCRIKLLGCKRLQKNDSRSMGEIVLFLFNTKLGKPLIVFRDAVDKLLPPPVLFSWWQSAPTSFAASLYTADPIPWQAYSGCTAQNKPDHARTPPRASFLSICSLSHFSYLQNRRICQVDGVSQEVGM